MKICVFASSSKELEEDYYKVSYELGKSMAKRGHGLVYGGGNQGLMGACFKGIKEENGYSLGIAPSFFDWNGRLSKDCTDFILTEDMRTRKALMESNSDSFIALPGGIGTYEELLEILTLRELQRIKKPIAIFNYNGYFDPFIEMMNISYKKGFIHEFVFDLFKCFDDIEEMLSYLENEKKVLENTKDRNIDDL